MRIPKVVAAGLLALAVMGASRAADAQYVVVSHDEWLTNTGHFGANEQRFVSNSLSWFGVGSGSTALIYSSSGFLANSSFESYLTSKGISWTVSAVAPVSGYDVVFTEGNTFLDAAGLGDYVRNGGNVMYMGGTGIGGSVVEAGYSNPFLTQFGLSFASSYNGLGTVPTSAFAAQGPFGAALFTGASSIFADNGQNISQLAPVAGVTSQLFFDEGQNGVFAAAAVTTTPEPASMALLATGLIGIAGVARRKRGSSGAV